jgi:UDP-glucose:(heptosyl)LPS alpha-1,3-glucosyltransferase
VRIAVVFPHANRRAGVERVAWELSNHLAGMHEAIFVGSAMEDREQNGAQVYVVRPSRFGWTPLTFRRAAVRAIAEIQPEATLTLGAECPPGDVYWVQSVHRSYLARGGGPIVMGKRTPRWTRRILPRHQLILQMEKRYFSSTRAQAILCTSALEQNDLERLYGIDSARCQVMPNGYDPAIFSPERRIELRDEARGQLELQPDDVCLLFVANELHRKGFGTLIAALAKTNGRSFHLNVVGKVSTGDYQGQIERLGLQDRIHWHGSTNDVFPFYAAADALVLPTQYEPFGIVIVEALACGLPVITSRLAGASPAVEKGEAGRLLDDPTDVAELAGYLNEAADPAIRDQWASGAVAAAEPYAWPRIFAEVEKVLEEALRAKNGATT